MRRLRKPPGDTLIEVIFAFAILGTIVGFAYTGAINAHKNAVNAEQRTQALEIAQYQKEALTAYRDSLPWDSQGGTVLPSFVDGLSGNVAIDFIGKYCLKNELNSIPGVSAQQWRMTSISPGVNCDDLATELASPQSGNKVEISFAAGTPSGCTINTCDTISAEVRVSWIDPFNKEQNIKNLVTLTRLR